ncbi:MAG: CRISPR-associated protein Csx16 [Vulcanimicrobiaceae bacterium]
MLTVIVSRHPAAVQFIQRFDGYRNVAVLNHATLDDVRGKHVIGNVPLRLAAAARKVTVIEFSGEPPRGQEYTVADMVAAGASLRTYSVTRELNERVYTAAPVFSVLIDMLAAADVDNVCALKAFLKAQALRDLAYDDEPAIVAPEATP